MNLEHELVAGAAELGLALAPEARQKLLDYLALLSKWNAVHNLTAVRELHRMVSNHLLDSLVLIRYLSGERIVDVGSGAGLPGIPLAVARSDWQVVLLEANHKKAAFLRQALIELNLQNAQVMCTRVEAWQPQEKFDIVTSRAFSDLAEFVQLARHLCKPKGRLIAMKGVYPNEELAQLPKDCEVEQVIALKVPGLAAERHLVVMKTSQS